MKTKNRWIGFGRLLAVIFMIVLFINAFTLFKEIRRDVHYGSRSVGLSTLNDYFDAGDYQKIYECSIANKYSDEALYADVSQYEAFGRYYHAYVRARSMGDNEEYLREMEEEKAKITWKKILDVIDTLEKED